MTHLTPLIQALLQQTSDAVILADADGALLQVSRAFEILTGFSAQQILLGDDETSQLAGSYLRGAIRNAPNGRWVGGIPCSDGDVRAFDMAVSQFDQGDVGYLAVLTPSHSNLLAASHRFGHDELTGLPNRDIFLDRVDQAILQVNRIGTNVALMIMGLDRFSLVNDALGHKAGDLLLVEVAQRLRKCIRETDTVVRLEGDKFALLMNIASVDDSVIVAEKVLKSVAVPFIIDGMDLVLTFSIGIGIYPQDATSADGLIKQVENALHYAKMSGRNQYQFFSSDMNKKAKTRLDLETRMRRALQNDEFVVYYQPKVSAEDERIVGAEALIRWIDPERGMISPAEFIPVAEETGLIEPIGAWVLKKACQENRAWQDQGLMPVCVSVNVSPRQFRSRGLVDVVLSTLRETGLDPAWLELEITESMLMNDVETAVQKMTSLRELGVGLSIDDFGTGYSSLSYLGRFPITTLKIDRAFISDVDSNPKTAEIARAIIGLSRGLNLHVVAEGCEVFEHIHFLREHGCSTVQGFYYSRPVPSETFRQMLGDGVVHRAVP